MPRIRSLFNPSGKMDKLVFVDSTKYGNHTRRAPRPGLKKGEPALKRQFSRTKYLNDLAGELNSAFRGIWPAKKSDLYQKMLKRFRKEPENRRGLLLMQLKSMEINPRYTFNSLGTCSTTVKELEESVSVGLQVQAHPPRGKYDANTYYYEVILFTWDDPNDTAFWSRQYSDWIRIGKDYPNPVFEFLFPKPSGTTLQWLLCLRVHLGVEDVVFPVLTTTGMQITDVGTFDKDEIRILEQRKQEEEKAKKKAKAAVDDIVRVKAKNQQ
ncbi:hypothetical protein [Flavihumibacter solisilvae]|uniref:Uncharacterized protein n=1 Tax=Flavihumibacter solisilvae TaxID=1349421 RepID=A0A0C1IUU8_9BACT|nr:hypothetical protein [Flavihumibacter solisilvae]KIC94274.1 hypothetical protein OI18_11585 [Flavihumibacter solisilvae]